MEPADSFTWAHRLHCPPAVINDSVKKILCTGLFEFFWDEIACATYPAKDALVIRKNILLHQLKQGTNDEVIQCIRNVSHLKAEQDELQNQVSKLEKEYEQQDFIVREKVNNLKRLALMRSVTKSRADLLELKHSQTTAELADYVNMKLVCQHLMPNTSKDLDPKKLSETLDVVTSLCFGTTKREVWDTISSSIGSVEIPTLWMHLYQNLCEDVENLRKSEIINSLEPKASEDSFHIGIAKACGQHICTVSKRLLYDARANKHQQNVLEYIERIETASTNSVNISEWLASVLEVQKLETEQKSLQNEITKIQHDLHKNNELVFDLIQLTSDIQNIDSEMEAYIPHLQQSLVYLKTAKTSILKTKEKLCLKLQQIIAMRNSSYDFSCLKTDLTSELDIFHDAFDPTAIRKILLKGDIGIYRHVKCCFNEASVSITSSQHSNITPYFPMIQIPIYSLIECYKNLTAMYVYKTFESVQVEENPNVGVQILKYQKDDFNTMEMLNLSNAICDKTRGELDEINRILNAWVQQTVKQAMEVVDKTVDDVSFTDWSERYNLLLYMIQNSA